MSGPIRVSRMPGYRWAILENDVVLATTDSEKHAQRLAAALAAPGEAGERAEKPRCGHEWQGPSGYTHYCELRPGHDGYCAGAPTSATAPAPAGDEGGMITPAGQFVPLKAELIEPASEQRRCPHELPPGKGSSQGRRYLIEEDICNLCGEHVDHQPAETAPVKIKIDTSDPYTAKVWETAQQARAEVASWPAWKRGEAAPSGDDIAHCNDHCDPLTGGVSQRWECQRGCGMLREGLGRPCPKEPHGYHDWRKERNREGQ